MPGSPKRQKATRKYEVHTAPFTAHWRAHAHCSAGLQGVQVLVPTGRPRKHPLLCPAPPSSKDAMTSLTAPAAAPRPAVPAPTDHCGGDACSKRGRKCRLRTLNTRARRRGARPPLRISMRTRQRLALGFAAPAASPWALPQSRGLSTGAGHNSRLWGSLQQPNA
jgi:hypothetical protein